MSEKNDFWNERFAREGYLYGTSPNDFLKAHAQCIPKGGKVLSLGEGEGRNAVFLAQLGYEVTALDQSEKGLEKTAQLAQKEGVKVQTLLMDLYKYTFEKEAWDGIISIFCHLPAELSQKVYTRIAQSLKPKGVFLLEGYTPEQIELGTGGPSMPELMYTAKKMEAFLDGLNFEKLEELEREIHEGKGHAGLSRVLQVIARKV